MRRMVRCVLVGAACLVLNVLFSGVALAQSQWGETVFRLSNETTIVTLVGRSVADKTTPQTFRYLHKNGDLPWSTSHVDGDGLSTSQYNVVLDASKVSFPSFDSAAGDALGVWYVEKSLGVRQMMRDVTRKTTAVQFGVRLEVSGNSGSATISDFQAMKAAATAGDRAAFNEAAANAWEEWYLRLPLSEADLIYQLMIDHPEAG